MKITYRPLQRPGPTPMHERRQALFKAGHAQTVALLRREAELLGATSLVIEVDVAEHDIRTDGRVRERAQWGGPAVAVSFASRQGPLRFATVRFMHWHDNLRGIALGLEYLRALRRYGIGESGEQYAGWRAIEAPKPLFPSAAEAEQWMRGHARDELHLRDPDAPLASLYRAMARLMHPDKEGRSRADWDRLDEAWRVASAGRGQP